MDCSCRVFLLLSERGEIVVLALNLGRLSDRARPIGCGIPHDAEPDLIFTKLGASASPFFGALSGSCTPQQDA